MGVWGYQSEANDKTFDMLGEFNLRMGTAKKITQRRATAAINAGFKLIKGLDCERGDNNSGMSMEEDTFPAVGLVTYALKSGFKVSVANLKKAKKLLELYLEDEEFERWKDSKARIRQIKSELRLVKGAINNDGYATSATRPYLLSKALKEKGGDKLINKYR